MQQMASAKGYDLTGVLACTKSEVNAKLGNVLSTTVNSSLSQMQSNVVNNKQHITLNRDGTIKAVGATFAQDISVSAVAKNIADSVTRNNVVQQIAAGIDQSSSSKTDSTIVGTIDSVGGVIGSIFSTPLYLLLFIFLIIVAAVLVFKFVFSKKNGNSQ
jgi:hypothetical protein